jgi:hypothetical protein
MQLLIGTDEAGYGPNLGPLVVAASVWQTPAEIAPQQLYEHLTQVITAERNDDDPRVTIADSKSLYSSGCGLAALENGVLSCLALVGKQPRSVVALWDALAANCRAERTSLAWHADEDEPLPLDGCSQRIGQWMDSLSAGLVRAQVELKSLRAEVVFPGRFNQEVERHENKATVLSLVTINLVRSLLDEFPDLPVSVTCDKHGGRNCYAHLLQHVFGDNPVRVIQESKGESVYRLNHAGRLVEFRFLAKGERLLTTALASMTAKYLRELSLQPFNRFWQSHVPGLKPTAGYPADARRFKAQILDDRILWRCR